MAYFDFPHTDLSQSNLEWLVEQAGELHAIAKTFERSAEETAAAAAAATAAATEATGIVSTVTAQAAQAVETANSASQAAAAAGAKADELEQQISGLVFVPPVHSVLLFGDNTDPNTIYPGTTWTKLAAGKYLFTAGDGVSPGSEGGDTEATANVNVTIDAHSLTVAEMPAHAHPGPVAASGVYAGRTQYYRETSSTPGGNEFGAFTVSASEGVQMQTGSAGTGAGHTHTASADDITIPLEPAYIAINAWIRSA